MPPKTSTGAVAVWRHAAVPFALLLLTSGCTSKTDALSKPQATFERIRNESHRGDFSAALTEAQQSYAAWQNHPQDEWYWKFKLLDADVLLLNGETRKAKALLTPAPPKHFAGLQARLERLEGYVAFREQNDAEARLLLLKAAAGADAISDYELEADCLLVLTAYARVEDAAATEKTLNKILELGNAHNLKYQTVAAYLNLGFLRTQQSQFAAAVPQFERAAQIAKELDAAILYSGSLGNLATCYYSLGDFDKALDLRKQAIAIQQKAGITTYLRDSYRELGSSQLLQGQTRDGIESMRRALTLTNDKDTPEIYSAIACNLASALESAGELNEAEQLIQKATAVNKGADTETTLNLQLDEAALMEARGLDDAAIRTYRRTVEGSKGYPAVEWSADAALAAIYAQKNDPESSRAARRYFASALSTIEASRANQLQSGYEITFLSALIHFYQDYVRYLMSQGDAEDALLVADSSRASVLTNDVSGLHTQESRGLIERVQAAARRDRTTFLFYLLAPKQSYLWVITEQEVKAFILPDEQEIDEQIRSYRHLLEIEKIDPLRSHSGLAARLFQTLVGPALPLIQPNSSIMIVPDGSIHALNFETLVVETPAPHYWIEDVTLSVAPSLNILTPARNDKNRPNKGHLIIGDPTTASADFPPLTNANSEIEQVKDEFPNFTTTVVRGGAAVPSAYRAAQPGRYSIIHIVAHAEMNEHSPLDSAIILSPQQDGYRLYARDIMQVPLNADLVTLSACRSAGARTLSGEGPVGFAWAFFQAGAENVIGSLWDVNDRSTADLMGRFYKAVDSGEWYSAALRQAKVAMLKTRFRKPYYWAPFQLYERQFPPATSETAKSN